MDHDRNAPATKGDVQDVKLELRAEMKAMGDRLVEAYRTGQTELLKAFYHFLRKATTNALPPLKLTRHL